MQVPDIRTGGGGTPTTNDTQTNGKAGETGSSQEANSIFNEGGSANDNIENIENREMSGLWDILKSFDKDIEFARNAKDSIGTAQEGAWDKSVFEDKDKFIEYYQNAILGDSDSISAEDFYARAVENGLMDESEVAGMRAITDTNGDGKLSRDELAVLIGTAFESEEYLNDMMQSASSNDSANTQKSK